MKTPTHNPPVEVDEEEGTVGALLAPDILVVLKESPDAIAAETEELHAKDLASRGGARRDGEAALLRPEFRRRTHDDGVRLCLAGHSGG